MTSPNRPGAEAGANPHLLTVAAAVGTRDPGLIRRGLVRAASRCDSAAVDEVLLMSCFVTGFPAGLAAMSTWADFRPSDPWSQDRGLVDAIKRGERVCGAVYGSRYQALIHHLHELHPDLPGLVVSFGYGAVMGRPALSLPARELCMVAMLVPWQAEAQLYAHLRGALEVGATGADIEAAIRTGSTAARAAGPSGREAEAAARRTWMSVTGRWRR